MSDPSASDPAHDEHLSMSIDALIDCREPLLIGVRHHSAALARVIPQILDEFKPETLLVEFFFRGRGFIFSGFHRQARGG